MSQFNNEIEALRLEEKWKYELNRRGVTNFIDRLILADLLEAKRLQENGVYLANNKAL